MRFEVGEEEFRNSLEFASMFLDPRGVIEATKGIKITSEDGLIILEATDLAKACKVRIPDATITEPGECVVPGAQITQAIRHQKRGSKLRVSLRNRLLEVDGGGGFLSRLATLDPQEFPSVPMPPPEAQRMDGVRKSDLLSVIHLVRFGADQTGKVERPFARSIFFDEDMAFATDTMKICSVRLEEKWPPLEVPLHGERILRSMGDTIAVGSAPNQLFLWDDLFYCVLNTDIKSKPPDVRAVFSTFSDTDFSRVITEEDARSFAGALRRVLVASPVATVVFCPRGFYVAGVGSGGEVIDRVGEPNTEEGVDFVTSYNAEFLLGMLPEGEFTFEVVTGKAAVLKTPDFRGLLATVVNHSEQRVLDLAKESEKG